MIDHVLAQSGMHDIGGHLATKVGQKPNGVMVCGKDAHWLGAGGSHFASLKSVLQV
jgi:short-subunit dehydrogenase involved in D-alanine esterification of teichoic acids